MPESSREPIPFFDDYPRFLETSKTRASFERLNARYTMLIDRHRHLLEGATVLDLASHDGRFTLAALDAGASHVVGVDIDDQLVARAHANMKEYGVAPDRYEFVLRDMFQHFDDLEEFDVVFCFGIMYHINNHMQLLSNIAGVQPKWLIVDTKVSLFEGSVIEVRSPLGDSPPKPGSHLEGYPSPIALDVMLASFGWEIEPLDWAASGLLDRPGNDDYRNGERVSRLVRGTERVAPEDRQYAVDLVHALQEDRDTQWMTIRGVAAKCEVNPYALRAWVARDEGKLRQSDTTSD
jgi:SAM-dependent methyltransferase